MCEGMFLKQLFLFISVETRTGIHSDATGARSGLFHVCLKSRILLNAGWLSDATRECQHQSAADHRGTAQAVKYWEGDCRQGGLGRADWTHSVVRRFVALPATARRAN